MSYNDTCCRIKEQRILELEAALKPFADAGRQFPNAKPDVEITNWHSSGLTHGHLQTARVVIGCVDE